MLIDWRRAAGQRVNRLLVHGCCGAHNLGMNLKSAAFLALVGMLLLTLLWAFDFIKTLSGVMSDVVPVMALLRSAIYLFAGVCVTVFFYTFHKAQAN
jgi:hypothetical protein